jgi:VanZ family protein
MLLMLIGLAVELVQPRFGRGAELMDLVADGLGGFIGILFAIAALAWAIRRDNRRSSP